jgi:iron(III) transport system ATP-binding protein
VQVFGDFLNLKDIDLQIKAGEFVCIIGEVGAGKSSLLKAIIGDLLYIEQSEIDKYGGLDTPYN